MDTLVIATNVVLVVDPKVDRPKYQGNTLTVPLHCETVAREWLKEYVDGLRSLYSVIIAVRNADKSFKENNK